MRYHERMVMLSVLDGLWKDHLLNMDHLKEGIGLRGYGQQDPLVAYKKESFDMFEAMMGRFQEDTVRYPVPDADRRPGRTADHASRAAAAQQPHSPPGAAVCRFRQRSRCRKEMGAADSRSRSMCRAPRPSRPGVPCRSVRRPAAHALLRLELP